MYSENNKKFYIFSKKYEGQRLEDKTQEVRKSPIIKDYYVGLRSLQTMVAFQNTQTHTDTYTHTKSNKYKKTLKA